MKRFPATGLLLAAVGLMLVMLLLAAVFPDMVDSSPILRKLVAPAVFLLPWGSLILFGWLSARLRPSQRPMRWSARTLSGIAIALATLFASFMVAIASGLVVPPPEDAALIGVLLAVAAVLGVYGFRRDPDAT